VARIVLTSSGSTGDVNPIVAVAVELHARGHRVSLVLEQRLCASIARLGIAVRPMAGDLDAFFRKHIGTILRAAFPETASTATSLFVRDYLVPNFEAQLRVLREACSDADVLVAPWLHHAASAAAEVAGVPWVTLVYSPIVIPSAYFTAYPPFRRLPRRLWMPANRFTWALGKRMFGSILDDPVNALRARFGLPRRRHLAHEGSLSPHLTCAAITRALVQRPPDWPVDIEVTGFCFWDTPADWQPSPALEKHLQDGRPLVAIYFGSMAAEPFTLLYRTAVDAALRAGVRTIVLGISEDALGDYDRDRVLATKFAPFSAVFPFCRAAIHHGGIGTAARVLQAGLPSLVVPWGYDQFATAMMLDDAGATRSLPARRMSVTAATRSLEALLAGEHHRTAAAAIQRAIIAEDGPRTLADAIESRALRIGCR